MDPLTKPEWRAGVNQVLGGFWTPYTPALTAATTSPTGWTTDGAYYRLGALVQVRFQLIPGASMTAGSGNYRISLPLPATSPGQGGFFAGRAALYDTSTGARASVDMLIPNGISDYVEGRYPATWPNGASTPVSNSAPWTWAASDEIIGALTYETAPV
jgi:hypothetical protein